MKSRYTLASIIGIGVIFLCLMIALPLLNGESGFLRTAQSNQQVHAETMREEGEAGEEADAEAKTKELEALAKVWAYALQTRDGKPRFDMMSDQAKEKFIQEQIIRAGEDWNYNIGYSSPWVEEFKIEVNEWTATITYLTRTSEPAYYYSMETVTFAEEKDSYVVANYDTVIDAEKLTDDIHWDLDTGTAVLENKWPILLSELDQSKGRLSALSSKGIYSKMVVQLKDKVRFFPNWEHSVNRDAVFVYQDVTQDGKPELITILTVATGTGLNIEEVHVLDSETLEEMNIESSLDYIQQHVTSKVTPEEIEIIVNNKNYSYSTMEEVGDSPWLFDEIAFGSIIKYEIDQQGLKVHVTGQVSAGGFIGNIVLTYEYKDDMFKVSKIEFEK